MAWVAVDEDGSEFMYDVKPIVNNKVYTNVEHTELEKMWILDNPYDDNYIRLPKGSIEKLIGKKLTWEDEPVELKDELCKTES